MNMTPLCEKFLEQLNLFMYGEIFCYKLHIKIMKHYARIIYDKVYLTEGDYGVPISLSKLNFIANAHDILKEKYQKKGMSLENFTFEGIEIPRDLNRYVRTNLNVLEPFGLDDYFNTDIQLHALAAAIFVIKEMGISDESIVYPIAFHSCPIIQIYETLNQTTRDLIDITMLADKLSSNCIRIHQKNKEVRVDLDRIVFGENDNEFNYTLGLFVARLLAQGESTEEHSIQATEYYFKRLRELNPLIQEKITIENLGGIRTWPKRKPQLLQMQ